MADCVSWSAQDEQPVLAIAVERERKIAEGRLTSTASGFGTGPEAHAALKASLARLSQLAVAFLRIDPFHGRKCLIHNGRVSRNACSEDFGRCAGLA